jgi:hypothetical protein
MVLQFSEWWDLHGTFILEVISILKTTKKPISVNEVINLMYQSGFFGKREPMEYACR